MAKKAAIAVGIAVAAIAISMTYGAIANPGGNEERPPGEVWKFRFSGSEWQERPSFYGSLGVLDKGYYEIGFVPMGDSPSEIHIQIVTKKSDETNWRNHGVLDEIYYLDRDLVDTGISKYYTWEYNGQKNFSVEEKGEYEISIGREGNLKGSVSVSVSKVDRSI